MGEGLSWRATVPLYKHSSSSEAWSSERSLIGRKAARTCGMAALGKKCRLRPAGKVVRPRSLQPSHGGISCQGGNGVQSGVLDSFFPVCLIGLETSGDAARAVYDGAQAVRPEARRAVRGAPALHPVTGNEEEDFREEMPH